MATLFYGTHEFEFDNRTLAHIRTVVAPKLMRQESFVFSWKIDGVQRSIWINPSTHLVFELDSQESIEMNREWIEILAESADTPSGMKLSAEPVSEISDSKQ